LKQISWLFNRFNELLILSSAASGDVGLLTRLVLKRQGQINGFKVLLWSAHDG